MPVVPREFDELESDEDDYEPRSQVKSIITFDIFYNFFAVWKAIFCLLFLKTNCYA